jgi:plastocyanin
MKTVLIILALIVVVGGGAYVAMQKKATPAHAPAQQQVMQKEQPTAEPTKAMTAQEITVEGGMFYFKPNEIKVKKGQPVKITFNNVKGMHNFVIDELNVKSETVNAGGSTTVEFTPDKTGSFEYYCSIGTHRAMGMKGTLVVE